MPTFNCFGCTRQARTIAAEQQLERLKSGRTYTDMQKRIEALEKQNERLKEEKGRFRDQAAEYRKENVRLRSRVILLEKENHELQKHYDMIRASIDRLVESVKSVSSLAEENASDIEELSGNTENSEDDVTEETEAADEPDSKDEPQEKREQTEAKLEELKKEIDDLKFKLKVKKEQQRKTSQEGGRPSSQTMGDKKTVPNSRQKSGRKPGGQAGHAGVTADLYDRNDKDITFIEVPVSVLEEVVKSKDFYKLKNASVKKQLVKIDVQVLVIQFTSEVYRCRHGNRQHVTGCFPDGLCNLITYDSSIKTFAAFLHTFGNMSYRKVSDFIYELTNGRLKLSIAWIAALEEEISAKTADEKKRIWEEMMAFPYMHVDGTVIYINGKQRTVLVCVSPAGTILVYSRHKGFEAARKAMLGEYKGTLIHDGESTFFNFGKAHQACLIHEIRYLRGAEKSEGDRISAVMEMRELLQQMIHESNQAKAMGKEAMPEDRAEYFRNEFIRLIEKAMQEYEEHPECRKYGEGYGIFKRLQKREKWYLYFLNDLNIPPTNNMAELTARGVKLHSKALGGYRDETGASVQFFLDAQSILETARINGLSRYKVLRNVFMLDKPEGKPSKKLREEYRREYEKAVQDEKEAAEKKAKRKSRKQAGKKGKAGNSTTAVSPGS